MSKITQEENDIVRITGMLPQDVNAAVMADAYAMIEYHDHKVTRVLINPRTLRLLIAGMDHDIFDVTGQNPAVLTLWGATFKPVEAMRENCYLVLGEEQPEWDDIPLDHPLRITAK